MQGKREWERGKEGKGRGREEGGRKEEREKKVHLGNILHAIMQ